MVRFRSFAAAIVALTLVLAGCGDDDETSGSPGPAEAEAGGEGGEGTLTAFCEAANEVETIGEPDVDWETASEEEIKEASQTFARERILPVAERVRANAPEAIRESVDTLLEATNELAETGDFEAAFERPEVQEADEEFHDFHLSECDIETVEVTAVDYEFEGVPDTLDAGVVSFEMTNEGQEPHEMVVFRKNEGVTESFGELLAAEAKDKVTFAAGAFAEPGKDAYAIADLEAGEYAMVCFIPVGAGGEGQEGQGPPHFTQGMLSEFTVQ